MKCSQVSCLTLLAGLLQTTLAQNQLTHVSKWQVLTGQPALRAGRQPVLGAQKRQYLSIAELNSTRHHDPVAVDETKIELTPDQVNTMKKLLPSDAVEEASEEVEKLSLTVEILIASAWILLIASSPFILTGANWQGMTKVHAFEFTVLLIWLAGGIYLFTNVIYFVSYHFEGERPLTIVQAVYMLSQIVTTVGYGDIGPANSRGQIFVAVYIIASLLVVGNIVSEVTVIVQDKIKAQIKAPDEEGNEADAALAARASEEGEPTNSDWNALTGVGQLNYGGLASSVLGYLVTAGIGAAFYHAYEGKTIWQAIYMSIVTLSTCGFGTFVAETPTGQAFGAFWMLFGVGALGAFVSQCMEFSLLLKQAQQLKKASAREEVMQRLGNVKRDEQGLVDVNDFMKFALVQAGHCSEDQIESILHFYHRLQPDKEHKVPLAALKPLVCTPREAEV